MIDDLLHEIDRYKGVYDPSKTEYLDWVFRYTCRLLECHGFDPKVHTEEFEKVMRRYVSKSVEMVQANYWKTNKETIIYVPPVEVIDDCLEWDIKHRREII